IATDLERLFGDSVAFQIDRADLDLIAKATLAEMKVGNYVQVLKSSHKGMLADSLKIAEVTNLPKSK
ncbi:hypothetical protein ABTO22_19570, partial [Acinetobacter baumannii]